MVHLCLHERVMDQLAAQAVMHGHSMGAEIKQRIEKSLTAERAEPKEWR